MDKIIFLDFDGVLNSVGTKDRVSHPVFGHRIRGIDDFRVKLVSQLCEETGAKVVISSTWREFFTLEQLRTLLESRGFKGDIIGFTPKAYSEIGFGFNRMRLDRGDEIQGWMDQNFVPKHFLVLDDLDTQFGPHHIQTSDRTGFFAGHMKRARRILKGEIECL